LIGGFLTEYSGLKFVMYYLAEYVNMITVSALAALLFFGGWYLWVIPPVFAFFIKVVLFLFLYIGCAAPFRACATTCSCVLVGRCCCRWPSQT